MSISGWDVREGNDGKGPGGLGASLDSRDTHGIEHIAGSAGRRLHPRKGPGCAAERHGEQGLAEKRRAEVGGLQKAGRASDANGGKTAELCSKNLCPPWGNGRPELST